MLNEKILREYVREIILEKRGYVSPKVASIPGAKQLGLVKSPVPKVGFEWREEAQDPYFDPSMITPRDLNKIGLGLVGEYLSIGMHPGDLGGPYEQRAIDILNYLCDNKVRSSNSNWGWYKGAMYRGLTLPTSTFEKIVTGRSMAQAKKGPKWWQVYDVVQGQIEIPAANRDFFEFMPLRQGEFFVSFSKSLGTSKKFSTAGVSTLATSAAESGEKMSIINPVFEINVSSTGCAIDTDWMGVELNAVGLSGMFDEVVATPKINPNLRISKIIVPYRRLAGDIKKKRCVGKVCSFMDEPARMTESINVCKDLGAIVYTESGNLIIDFERGIL